MAVKKKTKVKFAAFNPKTRVYRAWAGCYGGHTDTIVFFRKKPTHIIPADEIPDADRVLGIKFVDLIREHDSRNILADLDVGTFCGCYRHFDLRPYLAANGRPRDTEIRIGDLFRLSIALPLDEEGKPMSVIDFHGDW